MSYRVSWPVLRCRRGHDDLGDHYLECGDLSNALKCYSRARDYCTSTKHLVNMCLNVIKVRVVALFLELLFIFGRVAPLAVNQCVNACPGVLWLDTKYFQATVAQEIPYRWRLETLTFRHTFDTWFSVNVYFSTVTV